MTTTDTTIATTSAGSASASANAGAAGGNATGGAAKGSSKPLVLIAAVYLLGLFIGALDTGIVTPARTVIQNDLGVEDSYGIWMITIYTLAYAASIPIMGKLADKLGRKWIYLTCIFLFGTGSLLCGLAQTVGNFEFLLVSRAIQALGGGGIMPIATAEFGTSFPPEKRGMALGLVGGVYGIANVFGASAGSLILDIFGQHNWAFIFYINVPIAIVVVVVGIMVLPNARERDVKPIDILGTFTLTIMILSLLYALRNVDFFEFTTSVGRIDVYPFLILTAVLLPVFIFAERRAVDPIMNLSYFTNPNIIITLLLAIIVGVVLMGMVFLPQYAENCLYMPSGSGGYFIIILSLFAGLGAPVSGKLIDKFGVKAVLGFGLVMSVAGSLYLAFVSSANPSFWNVALCMVLLGLGMGFTMGTPNNYMMLEHTDEAESNSALATLSLVRSIGTAIAPAIMVGFIVHGAATIQTDIGEVLPSQVTISALPHADELQKELDKLSEDEDTKDMLDGVDIPNLTEMQVVEIDMSDTESSDIEIPDELIQLLKDSDVTNITENTKAFVAGMFDLMTPDLIADIDDGVGKGMDGIGDGKTDLDKAINEMGDGMSEMGTAISEMGSAISAQKTARKQMKDMIPTLRKYTEYDSVLDLMPSSVVEKLDPTIKETLSKVKTASDLQEQIDAVKGAMAGMEAKKQQAESEKAALESDLAQANEELEAALAAEPVDEELVASLRATIGELQGKIGAKTGEITGYASAISGMQQGAKQMEDMLPMLKKLDNYDSILDLMPDSAKKKLPASAKKTLAKVKTVDDLKKQIAALDSAISKLTASRNKLIDARSEMGTALAEMKDARDNMTTMLGWMVELKEAVPDAFEEAKQNYLKQVDERSDKVESVYQTALNNGFRDMFIMIAILCSIGLVLLFFYHSRHDPGHGAPAHKVENHGAND